MTLGFSLLAFALLSTGLYHGTVFLEYAKHDTADPWAVVLVTLGTAAALVAAGARWPDRLEQRVASALRPLLVALVLGQLALLYLHVPGEYLRPDAELLWFDSAVGVAALAVASWLVPTRRPDARVAVLLAVFVALGLWLIANSPLPNIDVWHVQQRAGDLLLHGANPYAADYPNIYPDLKFYEPSIVPGNRIHSFNYLPLTLLFDAAGRLFGDVRYAMLAAMAATALLGVALGRGLGLPRGHPAELAAFAALFHPRILYLLEAAWTEPVLAVSAAACALAVARPAAARARPFAVAAVASAKQFGVLMTLPLWRAGRVRTRDLALGGLLTAALIAPFFLLAPRDFLWGTVTFLVKQKFSSGGLTLVALVAARTGWVAPPWLSFATVLGGLAVVLRPRDARLGRALVAAAAAFLSFFLFSKQAFLNYYWFAQVLLGLGVVAAVAELERPSAKST